MVKLTGKNGEVIQIAYGTEIRVYRNLKLKDGSFSVQHKVGGKGPWVLAGYTPAITVSDAKFVVSEAARVRCVKVGQREVHAWVVGKVAPYSLGGHCRVTYNPFRGPLFHYSESGLPVDSAPLVTCEAGYAWILKGGR